MSPKRFHLLDMGNKIYGDCLLCEIGQKRILIDGGHKGDEVSREEFRSIPEQIAEILGEDGPFHFDLLVVTHAHADHIGCLPELVAEGVITAEWALVADEDMGFGHFGGQDLADAFGADALSVQVRSITRALQEESRIDLSDEELADFVADADTQESRYRAMLSGLVNKAGKASKIARYGNKATANLRTLKALQKEFATIGMTILGPTQEHLEICARALAGDTRRVARRVRDSVESDSTLGAIELYRQLAFSPQDELASDMPGKGAALNDMSVVLLFELDGDKVLLAGDMQFASPEVSGLNESMQALADRVASEGPFKLYKVSHHAAKNAMDQDILDSIQGTRNLVMSGGTDPAHPSKQVLKLLSENSTNLRWARTDQNKRITFDLAKTSSPFSLERGKLNDLTTPGDSEALAPQMVSPRPAAVASPRVERESRSGSVEIHAWIPDRPGRVTITVDIEDSEVKKQGKAVAPTKHPLDVKMVLDQADFPSGWKLASGRELPKLVFVTSREALSQKIGADWADLILDRLEKEGHAVFADIGANDTYAQAGLKATGFVKSVREAKGVVLLGGYEVVPPRKLDVLDPILRNELERPIEDADNYIVWSDGGYGDIDGDSMAELPVSRIPDCGSAQFVLNCLAAAESTANVSQTFGLRNAARPFADQIFSTLVPGQKMLASSPTSFGPPPAALSAGAYFMLHGSWDDTTMFWGEDASGVVEAFEIGSIPNRFQGVVFTGCCWGALIVDKPAARLPASRNPAALATDQSIALKFLSVGAQAFVGCTGTHYSPTQAPYNYFGGPLHQAFWSLHLQGIRPAEALFIAKQEYLKKIPHAVDSPLARAIELKIARQFCCLGLGW